MQADRETWRQVRWKKISMIFQAAMNALNPIQRVGDQILETIALHEPQVDRATARRRVQALYDQMGIPASRLDDYPHQYSGGMRQRAIIAMALACRPPLIIADEPTTALDVIVQKQILEAIHALQEQAKISLLFISHDIAVVADICHQVGVLYAGQLVEIGSSAEVFGQPVHPYTQSLLKAHISLNADPSLTALAVKQTADFSQKPARCRFVDQCAQAGEPCRDTAPQWQKRSATHWVRCVT